MHLERDKMLARSRLRERRHTTGALATFLVLLMILPVLAVFPPASSEPSIRFNPDGKRSLVWDFNDMSNYTTTNTRIAGGFASLETVNESIVENSLVDYNQGLTKFNLDLTSIPDSITIPAPVPQTFNVTLQPGAEGVDAYILESSPDWNSDPWMQLYLDSWKDKQYRPVLWFNLSAVPSGAVVHDAALSLNMKQAKGVDFEFDIFMFTRMWVENEVCWNCNSTGNFWTNPGGDYNPFPFYSGITDDIAGWHTFDISRLVDLWVRGVYPNYGVIFVPRTSSSSSATKTFFGSDEASPELRPKLMINYSIFSATGIYESRALGPGTNMTFTSAAWSNSTMPSATDSFSGGSLGQKWNWCNSPLDGGGAYDVGASRTGWLYVQGEGNTNVSNDVIGGNFLYENLTGDFNASTWIDTAFIASSMSAGLLLVNDPDNWIGIFLGGNGGAERIFVRYAEAGVSTDVATQVWSGRNQAFLRIDRIGSQIVAYSSINGVAWTELYSHALPVPLMHRLSVGPCIFSGPTSSKPVALWDYVEVRPVGASSVLGVRVRLGNSTVPGDSSWGPWSAPLTNPAGSSIGMTAKYIQYRVLFQVLLDWVSPVFSGITIQGQRYARTGSIVTEEQTVPNLKLWTSIVTGDTSTNGRIWYNYSVDHGFSWKALGGGGSYAISETSKSLILHIDITTYSTTSTPIVDVVNATYIILPQRLYLETPATVIAGAPFDITIYVKDENNNTMSFWMGDVTLHAMNASGASPASSELSDTYVYIPGGMVVKSAESYCCSETIRILALSGDASGLSAPIIVTTGPLDHIAISPNLESVSEYADWIFSVNGYDAYGNEVPIGPGTWTEDPAIGSLNSSTGQSVTLSTGVGHTEGYLNVTADGMTASLHIHVVPPMYPPEIRGTIQKQTKAEDFGSWPIDISAMVHDAEDRIQDLRWYITNENNIVTVIGENKTGNMIVTLSTRQDVWGTTTLRLVLVDSDGLTASKTFDVEITPINDPPTIDQVTPLLVTAGISYAYSFRYYIHDVDTPYELLTLSVDTESEPYAMVTWLTISFTYPQELNGTQDYVVVSVSDGDNTSSTVVMITVSDDKVPLSSRLPDLTMNQSEVKRDFFNLANYFSDPEGSLLFYASGSSHVTIDIQANHSVDFYAPSDWFGQEYIIFIATDPDGARAEEGMTVTVNAVNHPPSIGDVPDLVVAYDLRYEFDLTPYVSDPDGNLGTLLITTNEPHIAVLGFVLSILFPPSYNGTVVPVTITVTDGELSAFTVINIRIGDDPPPVALSLPDHSFTEDNPKPYPNGGFLDDFFTDDNGAAGLTFYAFTSSDKVNVTVEEASPGNWLLMFNTTRNYNGFSELTIGAIDIDGGLVEETVTLEVIPDPDAPVIVIDPDEITIEEGKQIAIDLSTYVSDPDGENSLFEYEATSISSEYIQIHGGVLVIEVKDFLGDKKSKSFTIDVLVRDETGLTATDTMTVTVIRAPGAAMGSNNLLYLAILALGGTAAGLLAVTFRMRKKPFVIKDMMLIHNDGFLIGRHATHHEGEIDENIMSGMMTAVLNFVEDSMAGGDEGLKTFGFKEYQVVVERGKKCFAAVVFEGDEPAGFSKPMKELVDKIEKIYKKKLLHWTGDIETDFAGVDVLIASFVKEHSKKGHAGRKGKIGASASGIFKPKPAKPKVTRKVKPTQVKVDAATGQKLEKPAAAAKEQGPELTAK